MTARLVVIVCSTSGDGDPPENARKFFRWLKKKTHPPDLLSNMICGVLALGDTNYAAFCRAGRAVHQRLAELGAAELLPRGDADEAVGLEVVVEPWRDSLRKALMHFIQQRLPGDATNGMQVEEVPSASESTNTISAASVGEDHPPPTQSEPKPPAGSNAPAPRPRVLFLYGSETGNSEGICYELHHEALSQGYPAQIACLNDWEDVAFGTATLAVIVCSTTGDAEPPQNARKFFRWLKKKTHPDTLLGQLQYAVLALGDTNYSGFCKAGRLIDQRLRQLGAKPLLERADADEAVGLELTVEPWRVRLWPALQGCAPQIMEPVQPTQPSVEEGTQTDDTPHVTVAGLRSLPPTALREPLPDPAGGPSRSSSPGLTDTTSSNPSSGRPPLHVRGKPVPAIVREDTAAKWSAEHPFQARILRWSLMTTPEAPSQVIKMTLGVPDWGWLPGDSIGIVPQNNVATVRELLKRLNVNPSDPFPRPTDDETSYTLSKIPFPKPPAVLTVEEVLTKYVDLQPKDTKVVPALTQHLPKTPETHGEWAQLKEWLVTAAFRAQVTNRRATILDILRDLVPHSCPEVRHLVQCLKPLQPRYYSIASSPLQQTAELDIAFSVVDYVPPKAGQRVQGVCTSWLRSLCVEYDRQKASGVDAPDLCIPIFLKPTRSFLLPPNLRAPIMMIGPGTGVAPFVSFLQHRRQQLAEAAQCSPAPTSPLDLPTASPMFSASSKDDVCSTASTESSEGRAVGETHLFFGCRNRNTDFLFRDQIEQFVEDGTLTSLHLAISQKGEEGRWYGGCYVQDKMMESSIRICHLLLACRAHLYVCGDAQSMARDVKQMLCNILEEVEGLGPEESRAILQHLITLGRYHEDIY
eukprot:EG_transcript_1932